MIEHHETLPSTSDRLRELAVEGAAPFTVVTADEQSWGRGRGGRSWYSPRGAGLWMSVLLDAPPGGVPGVVPLLAGVLVARAVEDVSGIRVGLKWPNDLLVVAAPSSPRLGKLGGVRAEAVGAPGGPGRKAAGT